VAPAGLQSLLGMEESTPTGSAGDWEGTPRSDSADEPRQSPVGSTKNPRRAVEAGPDGLGGDGFEIHGPASAAAVTGVARVSEEPRQGSDRVGFLHGAYRDLSGPVRVRGAEPRPALILLCAGTTCLRAGRIDGAASYAREALALARRWGARGSEAHALCVAGDVASIAGAEDADGSYREALALAGELGMRPLIAHCHLGLGKLYHRTDRHEQARERLATATTMYRDMGMTYWLEQAEAEMLALRG
jgi:tetratricopeptide (TPR) repeat protein